MAGKPRPQRPRPGLRSLTHVQDVPMRHTGTHRDVVHRRVMPPDPASLPTWQCRCGKENQGRRATCERCDHRRPGWGDPAGEVPPDAA